MDKAYLHQHIVRQIRINFGMFCALMFLVMMYSFNSYKHLNIITFFIIFGSTLVVVAIFYFTYYRKELKAFKNMLEEKL